MNSFSGIHYGSRNLFHVFPRDPQVLLSFVIFGGIAMTPVTAVFNVYYGRQSPVYILNVTDSIMDSSTGWPKSLLVLLLAAMEWAVIILLFYTMLFMAALVLEAMTQAVLALRTMR